jgi:aldehyde:ferredoxin oxidoreductase
MHGYHGRYLRIDVTTGQGTAVPLPEAVLRRYLGGVGLGAWILLQETVPGYDPLGDAAPLVFAFAPLAGTALNTTAKAAVLCKSPLTRRLNDAMMSSVFALTGKRTGYDALVLVGKRPGLNALFVDEAGVRIEATPQLAGLSAPEAERWIRQRHGEDWSVASIGKAGEAQVPFATISHDGRHAGRGGSGAVLGAKGLKAIAVRGLAQTDVADPAALDTLRQQLKLASLGAGTEKYRTTGTLGNLLVFNRIGILPTDNFQRASDPSAGNLSAERLQTEGKVVRATCADCMIGCEKRVVDASGGHTRIEYENVFALGPLIGNWDMALVLAASRLCDEVGLDTITMGATLGFARECAQRGLLEMPAVVRAPADFLLDAIRKTAGREDYGALLALGTRELARRIGRGVEAFAPHVKGLELPGYHPGALQTLGLGFAVGARGADHNKSSAYDLDLSGTVDRFALDPERVAAMVKLENDATLMDTLILCKFVRRAVRDLYADGAAMLAAVTGWAVTPVELEQSARSIHHLKKLFNQRQGWDASEDTLPARFFTGNSAGSAFPAGPASEPPAPTIDPQQFQSAKARYYELRGWGTDGMLPTDPGRMQELELGTHA